MISIYKIEPPENADIRKKYPQLNHIWENDVMQERSLKSYEVWNSVEKTGEVFLIKNDDEVIGVTGWWHDEKVFDLARLRWHGIISSERGKGYSEEALRLLLEYLNKTLPEKYKYVSESFSIESKVSQKIMRHFQKLGFVEFDDPTYGTNGMGPTKSLKVKIPGRD